MACRYIEASQRNQVPVYISPSDFEDGTMYWESCDDLEGNRIFDRYYQFQASDPVVVTPEQLAQRARAQLAIRYPSPRVSPDFGIDQLVGLDTWLWLEEDPDWSEDSVSASIPGLSVTATATPVAVEWDMGDGTVVDCDGPGTPYDYDVEDRFQSSDCTHVYQYDGTYEANVTVHWEVSWEATDGSGGTLDPVDRTTRFELPVIQRQAVGT